MRPDAIVVGGGISGLAAAVDLSSHGFAVTLYEQREKLGGRAYSYRDKQTGDIVDNGQHLLMGCFQNTKTFLHTIGSYQKLVTQNNLHVTFYHPKRGFVNFRCPNLPAPFHVIAGLLRLKTLSWKDRFQLLQVLWNVAKDSGRSLTADRMTVEEWLKSCNQSVESRKFFWNIIATATLNQKPEVASASLFIKVLKETFLRSKRDSVLMIPRVGLSKLYVEDACEFIRKHRGNVKAGLGVSRILFSGDRAVAVEQRTGDHIEASTVISAIPLLDLVATIPDGSLVPIDVEKDLDSLSHSPILTVNLWLDRPIMDTDFVSLVDSPIQWIFNKNKIFSNGTAKGSYLSCLVSGADELLTFEKDQLVSLALDEIGKAYPKARDAKLIHSLVLKEKRATLPSSRGAQKFRLPPKTKWKNFFLAGDWTDTGLPATIESAVTSGYTAAKLAHEYLVRN